MHLKRKIAPIHGIEEVKADRELGAEARVNGFPEQLVGMREDQVDGWNLHAHIAETEQQAVLFRNTVKAPCVVLHLSRQIADFFHPLAAPRTWIEKRNYSKRPGRSAPQTFGMLCSCDHLRLVALVRIEQEVELRKEAILVAIGRSPIYKEGALVLERRPFVEVGQAEVADLACTLPLLDLPPRQVAVHQQVPFIGEERCPSTNYEHQAGSRLQFPAFLAELALVKEFRELIVVHEAENGIVAQIASGQSHDRAFGKVAIFDTQDRLGVETGGKAGFNLA